MVKRTNTIINGSSKKDILIDTTFLEGNIKRKVVVFSHGFKGFKDWGPFNSIAEYFAASGFVFVKFNFSYNGTSIDRPSDFVDLDSFGNNNFCKELDDLGLVIDWVIEEFNNPEITLFGHSRGGAISILKSAEANCISNVVSWASPSDLIGRLPVNEKQKKWKETNVAYIYNGRTKQNMPLYYQFYKNCLANSERLSISNALRDLRVPHLHIHGDADPTVLVDEAYNIKKWSSGTQLYIIKGANHVFDGCHPYNSLSFPRDLRDAIDTTIAFLKA
ncbi:MAG: alpha/beta hydrolase [Flavobacteriales bacterium]|mgnify:FL=1|jgi:pimeloyl-ACP methyl ester carboxylesterase|nr:alpha/beta hydrolase [Flavobacteriales bacterium]|tara:strand:- start:2410 stop:3234 length:825 start_codon:yes stop_codon:yes gene_type:complete